MKRRLLCAALAACLLLGSCSQTPAKVKEIASEGTVPTTKETTTASSVAATTTTTEAAAETVETTTAAETTTESAEETTTSETVETTAETTTEATTTTTTAVSTTTAAPVATESTTKEAEQKPSGVLWTEEDIEYVHKFFSFEIGNGLYGFDLSKNGDRSADALNGLISNMVGGFGGIDASLIIESENNRCNEIRTEEIALYGPGSEFEYEVYYFKPEVLEAIIKEKFGDDFSISDYNYKEVLENGGYWNEEEKMFVISSFVPFSGDCDYYEILEEYQEGEYYYVDAVTIYESLSSFFRIVETKIGEDYEMIEIVHDTYDVKPESLVKVLSHRYWVEPPYSPFNRMVFRKLPDGRTVPYKFIIDTDVPDYVKLAVELAKAAVSSDEEPDGKEEFDRKYKKGSDKVKPVTYDQFMEKTKDTTFSDFIMYIKSLLK